jgi:L-lactate dehydrogenase complex protein LldG
MTGSREAILRDVAKARGSTNRDRVSIAVEAKALLDTPDRIRPMLPSASAVESFIQRVSGPKVAATVDRVSRLVDLPEAVACYLSANKLDASVVLQPTTALKVLDWRTAGIRLSNAINEAVAVGVARWGIAETGSVVFHSSSDTPILYNFLPSVQIVAVHSQSIMQHMEDYASAARAAGDPAPRTVCLITGASGTTDIEGTLVKGAHGPHELHIVVIDDLASFVGTL